MYPSTFTWGKIEKIHEISYYAIIEYHPWKANGCLLLIGQPNLLELEYSIYVNGKPLSRSTDSLDSALAYAIAFKQGHDHNSQAAEYFMKMIKP
jgi:hypothetical protein